MMNRRAYACCNARTWQVPWLCLVEVHVADGWRGEAVVHGLPGEVAGDELLVRREEAEARRQRELNPLLLLLPLHPVMHRKYKPII